MQEILVIDDTESIRNVLAEFLKDNGFDVTGAADGQAGLDLLKQLNEEHLAIRPGESELAARGPGIEL